MSGGEFTSEPRANGRLGGALCVGLTALSLLLWGLHLWPHWLNNPDLSHGLLAPIACLILLHEARTRGTARFLPASALLSLAIAAALAAALALLVFSGLYAAALDWSHALVTFLLTASLCALLLGTLLAGARNDVRWIPFNWPAFAAILLCALSTPVPPGTYTRLTQTLQGWVAEAVLVSLHFLGIAALKNGNVIELAHVSVGVEEACSGIRSLLSCVFVSIFISAVLLRAPLARLLIIALAAPLAVLMNFFRSLLLTLLAHSGTDITGFWHDATGFGVLVLTAVILAVFALLLRGKPTAHAAAEINARARTAEAAARASARRPILLLLGAQVLALAIILFFAVHTRSAPRPATPPDLVAALPLQAPGWDVSTRDDLYRFSSQLQTSTLAERSYRKGEDSHLTQITVYLAYWPPGQAPVSLVASHTPEACWPGSGWSEIPEGHRRVKLAVRGAVLPEAEHRVFVYDEYPQHVWYWHLYDGVPVRHQGIGSPAQLLSLAWHYGFRNNGEQLFVRISSNRSWDEIADEPLIHTLVARLGALGLEPQTTASATQDTGHALSAH